MEMLWAFGQSLVPLVISLSILGLLLIWHGWATQRKLRRAHVHEAGPWCAACGYGLRGLQQPQCPECGAGLTRAGSLSWLTRSEKWDSILMGWAIGLLIFGQVWFYLTPAVVPSPRMTTLNVVLAQPQSGEYESVTILATMPDRYAFSWSVPELGRPERSVSVLLDRTAAAPSYESFSITAHEGLYPHSPSVTVAEFERSDLLQWFNQIGINAGDPAVHDEAAAMVYLVKSIWQEQWERGDVPSAVFGQTRDHLFFSEPYGVFRDRVRQYLATAPFFLIAWILFGRWYIRRQQRRGLERLEAGLPLDVENRRVAASVSVQ